VPEPAEPEPAEPEPEPAEPVPPFCVPEPSAVSAAPSACVSDMPGEKRSLSAAATWSAWPPNATKPGSSVTEPSNVIR
jgi:hypothetical protein